MSRDDKLLAKVEGHRKDVLPFRDLVRYLDLHGWRFDRSSGSHMIFVPVQSDECPGESRELSIPLDHGRSVKTVYVKKAVKVVKEQQQG